MLRTLLRRLAEGKAHKPAHKPALVPAPVARVHTLSDEIRMVLESAYLLVREPNDNGPRVHVRGELIGQFWFDRDTAAQRVRRAWPELSDQGVARAVAFLAARVRVVGRPITKPRRKNWVNGWRDEATGSRIDFSQGHWMHDY